MRDGDSFKPMVKAEVQVTQTRVNARIRDKYVEQ